MQQCVRNAQATKLYRPGRAHKRNSERILSRFVELANLLDPQEVLPEPWEVRRAWSADKLSNFYRNFHRLLRPMRSEIFHRMYPGGVDDDRNPVSHSTLMEKSGRDLERLVDYPFSLAATGAPDAQAASTLEGSYQLFYAVRKALEALTKAAAEERTGSVWIPAGYRRFERHADGSINAVPDAFNYAFVPALAAGDASRIRRCPVCQRFYFAKPSHKKACDKHLALARVWRGRGKLPSYEENRRINRLVREGLPIGEAMKHVKGERRS